jgi:hypothetical protein
VTPIMVGTAVIAASLCALFVGAVWFAKRATKKTAEIIETLLSVEDTIVTIKGLALAA